MTESAGSKPSPRAPTAEAETGFHPTFNCLWCGRPHRTRGPDDLEGWALLCPECVGRAQDNEFLRFRLREGLRRRAAAANPPDDQPEASQSAGSDETEDEMRAYYAARAPEYDDFYLRAGRYDKGPIFKLAWDADLDAATTWLDSRAIQGEIVELAAGTGWWSPLLAQKGELWIYDAIEEPLVLARERLVAHNLRAHIHLRDAWTEPDRQVDSLFTGFWLSHVTRDRLDEFLRIALRWLKPGGTFTFIDGLPDTGSSAVDHPQPLQDRSIRRLNDGREFEIPKIYHTGAELTDALLRAGFQEASIQTTSKFFLLGEATAPKA